MRSVTRNVAVRCWSASKPGESMKILPRRASLEQVLSWR